MSEYIVEWSDIGGQLASLINGNVPLFLWPKKIREERRREKIVRCRDCAYRGWGDAGGHFCTRGIGLTVEPDGFCAWGEKKE